MAAGVGLVFADLALKIITTNKTSVSDIKDILTDHLSSNVEDIKTVPMKLRDLVKDERLVIFIDDLDRCTVENALDMLEAVKMFLNVEGVISIMAVDIQKLERAWGIEILEFLSDD